MASESSTAKPLIESHGLALHKLRRKHIIPFYENLSTDNIKELEQAYGLDRENQLPMLLHLADEQMVFVVTKGEKILAMTGLTEEGMMWAMFSKDMHKNWVRFARASPELIRYYHHFFDEIECRVWIRNGMIHQWLAHLGFEAIGMSGVDGVDFVHFVRCKENQDNVHSLMSRPVMH